MSEFWRGKRDIRKSDTVAGLDPTGQFGGQIGRVGVQSIAHAGVLKRHIEGEAARCKAAQFEFSLRTSA